MKIRLLVFSFISFFCIQNSSSQNAKEILDKVSSIYSDNAGFEINFTLNTEDVPNKTTYTHDGKAYIKGNKFKIDVPDGVTWFDGKTQWMYLSGNDEVNVTNPTNEELMSISPIVLLNMYKTGFKLVDKGTVTEKGKQLSVIEMIPQKKGSDVSKFILKVDRKTNFLQEICIEGKDKINNRLIIKKQTKSANLSDSFFVFNKKEFPNAEVIDLR